MEASQASEAGSIPVARSTTARLRAERFCCALFAGANDMPRASSVGRQRSFPHRHSRRAPLPTSSDSLHAPARAGTKLSRHAAPSGPPGTKLSRHAAPSGPPGTKLSQHARNTPFRHVLRQQGESYAASTTNRSNRAKKVTHQHPTSPTCPTNAPLPPFSHVIRLRELSTKSENVAIPTITIQILK